MSPTGFRRISDDKPVNLSQLSEADTQELFYKDAPYTTKKLHQRLIITYSPKYALYQKTIRNTQIERAKKMLASGSKTKNRRNPNDPARFIGKTAATEEGEAAQISYYLDIDKIAEEEMYDGLYAVCTDLLEDSPADILRVSEGRWQIEACFRVLKTDFSARPVFVRREDRVQAHFLTCFLSLLLFRLLEKKLPVKFTSDQILTALKNFYFADIQSQGFMPLYPRESITDALHETAGFRTDFQFIRKSKMREILKLSKLRQ